MVIVVLEQMSDFQRSYNTLKDAGFNIHQLVRQNKWNISRSHFNKTFYLLELINFAYAYEEKFDYWWFLQ